MAIDATKKHANFIQRSVKAAQQFKASYDRMVGLRAEWDSMDYGHVITDGDFSVVADPDSEPPFQGRSFPYIGLTELTAFYTSEGNLVTFWTSGNGTNISRILP